ncbi:MAG: class 1 fructose-bisphosphatase [candidate division NC10 bacterium]
MGVDMKGQALPRYLIQAEQARPETMQDLAALLFQISLASKAIARELGRAALAGNLGTTGEVNVQGEMVKKLDLLTNEIMVDALEESDLVSTIVSEEMDEPLHFEKAGERAKYVVCIDPVDGSSNLDINGVVGTFFSIRRRKGLGSDQVAADVLQPGTAQVAAGYVMYGPSTVFLYTARDGLHAFTLDPTLGEFLLSQEDIRMPAKGKTYSVNEGHFHRWHAHTRRLVEYLRTVDKATGRPYSLRYAGSMVADLHRTLLEGGIFLYPADVDDPKKPTGKLRLLYEAAPAALIVEEAGGRASTGTEQIMDIQPTAPHQRVPLIIGSPEDVALAEEFYQERR